MGESATVVDEIDFRYWFSAVLKWTPYHIPEEGYFLNSVCLNLFWAAMDLNDVTVLIEGQPSWNCVILLAFVRRLANGRHKVQNGSISIYAKASGTSIQEPRQQEHLASGQQNWTVSTHLTKSRSFGLYYSIFCHFAK